MKKLFLTIFFAFYALFGGWSQEADNNALAGNAVPVVLRSYGEYAYNQTVANYGSLAVSGKFSFTDYFDFQAGIKVRTNNIHALDIRGMVYFPLSVGRLVLEPRVAYEASLRTTTHHFNAALSLGYQMNHFRVQLGWSMRTYRSMETPDNSASVIYITDPFNLYYSLEGYLRKDGDFWNVGVKLANYDEFIIEHDTHPIVTLIGKYRPTDRLGIFAELFYRASGVAHVANNFYEAGMRVGINYLFNL